MLIKECNKVNVLPAKGHLPLDKTKHFLKTIPGDISQPKAEWWLAPHWAMWCMGKQRQCVGGAPGLTFPPTGKQWRKKTKPGGMWWGPWSRLGDPSSWPGCGSGTGALGGSGCILGSSCSSSGCHGCGLGSTWLLWAPFSFLSEQHLGLAGAVFQHQTRNAAVRWNREETASSREGQGPLSWPWKLHTPSLASGSSLCFLLLEPCPRHDVDSVELNSARNFIPFFSNHGTKARALFHTTVRH